MDRISCLLEPTEEDLNSIHQMIVADEEAIQILQSKMGTLDSLLERLRLQKSKHQENIRRARSLLTLARRLPPELLARIFEMSAESGWRRAPIATSQVCSAWRRAAAFPHVWSHLFLDLSSGNSTGKVEFWLSKVKQAPLHITLDIPLVSPSLEDVLGLLVARCRQWYTLNIKSVTSATMNYVLNRCSNPLPALRQLNLITEMGGSAGDLVNVTSLAPRLSRLLIEQPNFPRWSNFAGITKLHIVLSSGRMLIHPIHVNATDWIEMVQTLPELRDLTLEFTKLGEHLYNTDTEHAVDLPHLESLTLHVPPEVNGILLTMRAPVLRRLHLRCSSDSLSRLHTPSGAHLCRFLEYSPSLQLLELYDIDVERLDFVRCFGLLPKLEELRLHDSDIADEQLQLLQGPHGSCPNLARLDFRWCNYLTGNALVKLAQSRLLRAEDDSRLPDTTSQMRSLDEVVVINCLHVKEQDVLDLAEMTICRLLMRSDEDHCCKFVHFGLAWKKTNVHYQMEGAVAITRGIDYGCDYAITTSFRKSSRGLFSD